MSDGNAQQDARPGLPLLEALIIIAPTLSNKQEELLQEVRVICHCRRGSVLAPHHTRSPQPSIIPR